MKISKFFSLILIIFALSNLVFAQSSPTESKEEKDKVRLESEKKAVAILEQVVGARRRAAFAETLYRSSLFR